MQDVQGNTNAVQSALFELDLENRFCEIQRNICLSMVVVRSLIDEKLFSQEDEIEYCAGFGVYDRLLSVHNELEKINNEICDLTFERQPASNTDKELFSKQYLEHKKQNPDCMLLFLQGDHYELYFEDAINSKIFKDDDYDQCFDAEYTIYRLPKENFEDFKAEMLGMGRKLAVLRKQ